MSVVSKCSGTELNHTAILKEASVTLLVMDSWLKYAIVYVAAGYYTNRLGVAYLMEQRRMSPTLNRKEFIRVAPHLKTKFIWPN